MIESIVAASGERAARLTTLGAWIDGARVEAETPAEEFLHTVEGAIAAGVRTLALEVTSKALQGGLARRWPARVAVFTNLSRDHLDMHQSPEAYLAAKAQLFLTLPPGGTAVFNADDPASEMIESLLPAHVAVRRFSVTVAGADLAATAVDTSPRGTHIALAPSPLADRLGGALALSIAGDVHAQNALAAALAADALGYAPDAIRRGLHAFSGVPGRFEIIATDPLVVVDYAHTPDGLDGTLRTARGLVGDGGRLVCVFGCGGDRDRGKRPQMGAVAHRLADVAVLTSDNPRREPPETIAAAVRAGAEGEGAAWHQQLDRPAAIRWAIEAARPGDVVVIAGKGHEDVQEIGDQRIPMSDAAIARAICFNR
jgi:UDP-N-acetylmuramoyl-L-alanyl-D-glutamate--2,6-diaminopimelate ligase